MISNSFVLFFMVSLVKWVLGSCTEHFKGVCCASKVYLVLLSVIMDVHQIIQRRNHDRTQSLVAQCDQYCPRDPDVVGSNPTRCFTLKLYFEERRR